jgi:hypothetical protein
MKSASVHFARSPAGVRLAAGGQLGGPAAILPPENRSPWQPVQEAAT